MNDESKAEAFGVAIIFIAFVAIILSAPSWMPILDEATTPKPIVLVECTQ